MSLATTTVYLYIGLDTARQATPGGLWPPMPGGHLGLVDWLESWAEDLERLYASEYAELQLSCVFDYDVTEELGAWLYTNPNATYAEFKDEADRLVHMHC